jgi:hypothetical protein
LLLLLLQPQLMWSPLFPGAGGGGGVLLHGIITVEVLHMGLSNHLCKSVRFFRVLAGNRSSLRGDLQLARQ